MPLSLRSRRVCKTGFERLTCAGDGHAARATSSAARPMRSRSAGDPSRRHDRVRPALARREAGFTSRPLTPSVSQSRIPPTSNATAGRPSAAASRPIRPNGSGHRLGTATSDAAGVDALRAPRSRPTRELRLHAARRGQAAPLVFLRPVAREHEAHRAAEQRAPAIAAASISTSPPLSGVIRPPNSTVSGSPAPAARSSLARSRTAAARRCDSRATPWRATSSPMMRLATTTVDSARRASRCSRDQR